MMDALVTALPAYERECLKALLAEGLVAGQEETVLAAVASLAYKRAHAAYSSLFVGLETDVMKQRAKEEVGSAPVTTALTYGEIDFHSWADILERLDLREGDTLVDLGSGTGKALVTACLLFGPRLARIHGVELLECLHSPCEEVLSKLSSLLASDVAAYAEHTRCRVTSERGDFTDTDLLQMDWTVADVVFLNSTLFDAQLMTTLCALASARMRKGTRVVTLTRPWISPLWRVEDERLYKMSWGAASCFVHVKL